VAPLLLLLTAACQGEQAALSPVGPQADRIARLFHTFLVVTAIVYAIVIVVLLIGVVRARRRPDAPPTATDERGERRMRNTVAGAAVLTALITLSLLTASVATGRSIHALGDAAKDPLTVQVTGRQWWWEFKYLNPVAENIVTTANELHIPTGQPVRLVIHGADVIHSFWVPNLHGKKDAIPGWENVDYLQADEPGIYRGQCAEYCGAQHAHMMFTVFADRPADFERWMAAQKGTAQEPRDDAQKRGRDVFMKSACPMCHQIGGTLAHGAMGPDLTHLASRQTIASGTLPNTPGNLAGWILDPQGVKPGNHMPPNDVKSTDLQDLLAYLGSLR
jgi:cytochrome c oxidase subunit 2